MGEKDGESGRGEGRGAVIHSCVIIKDRNKHKNRKKQENQKKLFVKPLLPSWGRGAVIHSCV